jgi:TolA-binding protein
MESKKRVKYIKELEHKIKELEKELLKKQENYIKELENKIKELEKESTSQKVIDTDCTDSAQPLMPHRSFTDLDTGLCSSEMVDGTVVLSTPMEIGASEEIRESVSPEAEEELLASDEEELPDFNTVEDLRQWLGV